MFRTSQPVGKFASTPEVGLLEYGSPDGSNQTKVGRLTRMHVFPLHSIVGPIATVLQQDFTPDLIGRWILLPPSSGAGASGTKIEVNSPLRPQRTSNAVQWIYWASRTVCYSKNGKWTSPKATASRSPPHPPFGPFVDRQHNMWF